MWCCAWVLLANGIVRAEKPLDLSVVPEIDLDKYYGTWYEVARIDYPLQRGVSNVTAIYLPGPDATIRVIHRGYKQNGKLWQVEGRIKIPPPPVEGRFRAVYYLVYTMEYTILELDTDHYTYALVGSKTADNLWILSRRPTLPQKTLDMLIRRAMERGFDTSRLIFTTDPFPQNPAR